MYVLKTSRIRFAQTTVLLLKTQTIPLARKKMRMEMNKSQRNQQQKNQCQKNQHQKIQRLKNRKMKRLLASDNINEG